MYNLLKFGHKKKLDRDQLFFRQKRKKKTLNY